VKILVVANPVAGAGRAREPVGRLVRRLEERGHAVECVFTEGPGDAHRHAARAGAVDRLVVAGGDGTLNEVVNGLPDPAAVPLAHLALGTANMLARELRLPRRPEALAELLETGSVRRLDLGRIGDERFLLVASAGFDALVTREVARHRRESLGYLGYAVPIARALRRYRPPVLRVRVDDGEPVSGALAIVSNVRNYGGLFEVADRARVDSGVLDAVVFREARVRDLLRFAAAARLGRVSRLSDVTYRRGTRIAIESDAPVPVEVDGDFQGETPVTLEVLPGAARAVAPPPAPATGGAAYTDPAGPESRRARAGPRGGSP